MKTKNLLFAGAIALSTVMSPMAAMISATPVFAANQNVTNDTNHDYIAYQIFSGTQREGSMALGEVSWGSDVDLTKMTDELENSTSFSNCKTAADVVEVLKGVENDSAVAKEFARMAANSLKSDAAGTQISKNDTSVNLDPGYYLFVDQTVSVEPGDVVGLSLLQVTNNTITITKKTSAPTVDKKVQDEETENGNKENPGMPFVDSADHHIGEVFKFQLKATVPAGTTTNFDTYKLIFYDELSTGVDFVLDGEKPKDISVKVNGTEYSGAGVAVNGKQLTVTIENLLALTNVVKGEAVEVVVEYSAVLNSNAVVTEIGNDGKLGNSNKVKLQYSNNPNNNGTGYTTETQVFVGTYKLPAQKVANTADGAALARAKFKLRNDEGKYAVISGGKVTGWVDKEEDGSEIVSTITGTGKDARADFSVEGLDAGTYTLIETEAPAGYNKAADTTVVITAAHEQNQKTDKVNVTMTQNGNPATDIKVIDTDGGTLPETGGMGTTMIYGIGTVLVAGAAIAFVTNKRMRNEQ